MTPAEFIREAKRVGWKLFEHGGNHDKYKHPTKPGMLTVPRHTDDLKKGTLNQLLKLSGVPNPKR